MTYRVIDIEGVGEVYAQKLTLADIETVDQLLEAAATPRGRARLAEVAGIPEPLILRWANHADLMRLKGVGPQYAELLEAAGVDTVKELKHRNAENLTSRMHEVNTLRNLTGRVPTVPEVERLIAEAKELEPKLTY